MPKLPPYEYTGPVDCTIPSDPSKLKGKSVIVTGGILLSPKAVAQSLADYIGANGMGETTVRKFAEAGSALSFPSIGIPPATNSY
jgi:hypothetical protein